MQCMGRAADTDPPTAAELKKNTECSNMLRGPGNGPLADKSCASTAEVGMHLRMMIHGKLISTPATQTRTGTRTRDR